MYSFIFVSKMLVTKIAKFATVLTVLLFFVSCGGIMPTKKKSLDEMLVTVSKDEAHVMAKDIREFSQTLKERYDLIPYPNFNNFLINIGVKERGLCWQLAFDLLEHLKAKKYNVDYYIAGANIGEYFKEHNVVVLTCRGCEFKNGILLDIWRNGGDLYYSRLNDDKEFKWKQRGGIR